MNNPEEHQSLFKQLKIAQENNIHNTIIAEALATIINHPQDELSLHLYVISTQDMVLSNHILGLVAQIKALEINTELPYEESIIEVKRTLIFSQFKALLSQNPLSFDTSINDGFMSVFQPAGDDLLDYCATLPSKLTALTKEAVNLSHHALIAADIDKKNRTTNRELSAIVNNIKTHFTASPHKAIRNMALSLHPIIDPPSKCAFEPQQILTLAYLGLSLLNVIQQAYLLSDDFIKTDICPVSPVTQYTALLWEEQNNTSHTGVTNSHIKDILDILKRNDLNNDIKELNNALIRLYDTTEESRFEFEIILDIVKTATHNASVNAQQLLARSATVIALDSLQKSVQNNHRVDALLQTLKHSLTESASKQTIQNHLIAFSQPDIPASLFVQALKITVTSYAETSAPDIIESTVKEWIEDIVLRPLKNQQNNQQLIDILTLGLQSPTSEQYYVNNRDNIIDALLATTESNPPLYQNYLHFSAITLLTNTHKGPNATEKEYNEIKLSLLAIDKDFQTFARLAGADDPLCVKIIQSLKTLCLTPKEFYFENYLSYFVTLARLSHTRYFEVLAFASHIIDKLEQKESLTHYKEIHSIIMEDMATQHPSTTSHLEAFITLAELTHPIQIAPYLKTLSQRISRQEIERTIQELAFKLALFTPQSTAPIEQYTSLKSDFIKILLQQHIDTLRALKANAKNSQHTNDTLEKTALYLENGLKHPDAKAYFETKPTELTNHIKALQYTSSSLWNTVCNIVTAFICTCLSLLGTPAWLETLYQQNAQTNGDRHLFFATGHKQRAEKETNLFMQTLETLKTCSFKAGN